MTKPVSPHGVALSFKRLPVIICAVIIWLCLFLLCLEQKAIIQALAPRDADNYARELIESIRAGNYDKARTQLDPSLRGENIDKGFRDVHDIFTKGELRKMEVTTFKVTSSDNKHRSDLYYQLHFQDYWAGGNVIVDTQNGAAIVSGFHFHRVPDSVVDMYRFSLIGKSISHYIALACCLVIPAIILYSLMVCISARVRLKWLWIIFIFSGLMKFSFEWSTGAWSLKPLSIILLGSSFNPGGPETPWVFYFGLPVGAVVFLVYRRIQLNLPVSKRRKQRVGS